jgi:uncharacterized membrane protein
MTERRLRLVTALVAVLGLAVAGYLTYVHYAELEPLCVGGGGGCERVQSSDYAELAGIPVAVLGVAGYALILASLWVPGDAGRVSGALLALIGFGFSMYLTWVELFEIDAICQWCVVSAVLMTVLALTTACRLVQAAPGEPPLRNHRALDEKRQH